ncbi:Transducin/WD40 repeat-like superfamily protein [Prunus dulcis]|uniref:Transducin/WD40 repeat-like superfamily protein n=1 Tax=Prunus dulcis TaxID=3755 RepID=A0A4Y1RW74_PRUDU|nr:Transducin/WD40 repeat-like superfamily protein [Prunus dulcis]
MVLISWTPGVQEIYSHSPLDRKANWWSWAEQRLTPEHLSNQSKKQSCCLGKEFWLEKYMPKLKEIGAAGHAASAQSTIGVLEAELEETKRNLQKVREENKIMAYCIKSLRDDLDRAKKELDKYLKAREFDQKDPVDPEIEEDDLKFIEDGAAKFETKTMLSQDAEELVQKKRYVKFASPPTLAQVIVSKEDLGRELETLLSRKSRRSHWCLWLGGFLPKTRQFKKVVGVSKSLRLS